MTIETATYIADLDSGNPAFDDVQSEGDDHLRLLKNVLQATFPGLDREWNLGTWAELKAFALYKVDDYNVAAADGGKLIVCDCTTTAVTLSLPALAGAQNKLFFIKKGDASANAVILDGNGAEAIDGSATVSITQQYETIAVYPGTSEWHLFFRWGGTESTGATGDAYAASHEIDITAHAAASIVVTPAGNITSTNVGAALNELDSLKAAAATAVSASGGSLTDNRLIRGHDGGSVDIQDSLITVGDTGTLALPAGVALSVDIISEVTAAAGVTIDTVLVKDGSVAGRDVAADGARLDTMENGATADQTPAEIEDAYNSQVPQVSGGERTAGTETAARRFSPEDIATMAGIHGGGIGGASSGVIITEGEGSLSAPMTITFIEGASL